MADIEPLSTDESFRLREYLGVIRSRKWSILVITLLAFGAAVLYAQTQTPMYRSEARVLATNPLAALTRSNILAPPNMDTERVLVSSTEVTKCASELLRAPDTDPAELCTNEALADVEIQPGLRGGLSVAIETNTNILVIRYTDPRPLQAQTFGQAFADGYIAVKTIAATERITELRAGPEARVTELTQRAAEVEQRIAELVAAGQQVQGLIGQLNSLNNQLGQLNATLLELSPAQIDPPVLTQEATLPASPASPNKPLIAGVGLFVGLAFGIGLALLRERLDDRLRGRADLEQNLGAPVLAVIPKVPAWRHREEPKLVTIDDPRSTGAEAYRTLRTGVIFTAVQRDMKSVMVVSPTAGEGKTTTACNLAVALADADKRVVLLSADLRKPRLHRFFGLQNERGLSSVLAGEIKPWEALQDPRIENLRVMASGPVPARPAELLQSERMRELLAELRDVADIVVLDTAPVLLVADALGLAPLVDGVLFVADAETTSGSAVAHAREQMEQVSAPLLGAVLNNFDPAKARGYGYGYGYGSRYRYGYGSAYGYGASYGHGYDDGEARGRARSRVARE